MQDETAFTLRGTIRSIHPERKHLYVRVAGAPSDVLVRPESVDDYDTIKDKLVIGATLEFIPFYLLRAARARLID